MSNLYDPKETIEWIAAWKKDASEDRASKRIIQAAIEMRANLNAMESVGRFPSGVNAEKARESVAILEAETDAIGRAVPA